MKDSVFRRYLATLVRLLSWKALAAPLLMIGSGLVEGLGVLLLIPMLQIVGLDVGKGGMGRVAGALSSIFAAVGLRPTLAAVLGLYVLIAGGRAALVRRESTVSYDLQYEFLSKLRTGLYRAIAGVQWTYFARRRQSDFVHVLTSEMDRVGTMTYLIFSLASRGILAAVSLAAAFRLSAAMAGIVLGCGAALALLLKRKIRASREAGASLSREMNGLYAAVSEHLAGMKTARSFGVEGRHVEIFAALSEGVRRDLRRAVGSSSGMRAWSDLGSALILCLLLFGSLTWLAVPPAAVLLLLFIFFRLTPVFAGLQQSYQAVVHALPAFAEIDRVREECERLAEPAPLRSEPFRFEREIRLEGITFRYGDGERPPVVKDVSLAVDAGRTIAVVGPSGAGKSTIADLIIGLIVPDAGRVLVDGAPVGPERRQSWREQIGYVAQDTFLFHDTIRANLLWAKPGAGDDEIRQALRAAAIEDFVGRLPRGLETVLGDRGVLVSGGERQRLALARALLRRPALLILDEATSSLDTENEVRIRTAIEELHGRMAILIISHRLSTVRGADRIYVLEDGRVVESGAWAELLARPAGRFREMCATQGIDGGLG
jgi:ATP-binding cassette, subfamily C, bacterial